MACGLPMVATDVGGIGDYVDDTCARLVPPGDIEGMCHTITSVLADDEQRKALGSASRQRALKFDWSHMTDRLVSVYETIVK
jgi:glycosyltransferase involved in cell wall biosynthesis